MQLMCEILAYFLLKCRQSIGKKGISRDSPTFEYFEVCKQKQKVKLEKETEQNVKNSLIYFKPNFYRRNDETLQHSQSQISADGIEVFDVKDRF